jgi:putative membrane protein
MRPHPCILATVLIGMSFPLHAQIGNPAGMAPGTEGSVPSPSAGELKNTADELFVRLAGVGGLVEVDLGTLAGRKSMSDAVKSFARQMIDDHSKANVRLAAAAKKADIDVPKEPDAEHKAIRARLDQLGQDAFDLAYMNGQVQDHIKTVQLLQWEISSGQNRDIQQFAAETLPTVLAHLQMAQDLLVRLRGEASR